MFSGVTATLIGVACVWNTGTEQSWMDRVSGIRIPLPMQISRSRLPPEQGSSSSGHMERSMPFTSPTVSVGLQSTVTASPSLFGKINRRVTLAGSSTKGGSGSYRLDDFFLMALFLLDATLSSSSSLSDSPSGAVNSSSPDTASVTAASAEVDGDGGDAGATAASAAELLDDSSPPASSPAAWGVAESVVSPALCPDDASLARSSSSCSSSSAPDCARSILVACASSFSPNVSLAATVAAATSSFLVASSLIFVTGVMQCGEEPDGFDGFEWILP
mmetsp:Transcript_19425/g.45924  ORF Transcript_19425/g.45924 Transcript_19425/m.45924 type:complete len:275 (-) Transcript_19425:431-1255(-)